MADTNGYGQNSPSRAHYRNGTLAPEDAAARKQRINRDIISLFHSSADCDNPPFVKGIGIYTHVEGPRPRPPLQRFDSPEVKPVFLPLGGPQRVPRRGVMNSDLPGEVIRAYEKLRIAVAQEEMNFNRGSRLDPRAKYGVVRERDIMIPRKVSTPPFHSTDGFLAARRDSVLASLRDTALSQEQTGTLKKALDEKGWPKKYSSVEAYNSSSPLTDNSPWLDEDTRALVTIRDTSGLIFLDIANAFFPGRSMMNVLKQYERATGAGDGNIVMSGMDEDRERKATEGERIVVSKRKSMDGGETNGDYRWKGVANPTGRQPTWGRFAMSGQADRRLSGSGAAGAGAQRDSEGRVAIAAPFSDAPPPSLLSVRKDSNTSSYDVARDPRRRR